MADRRDNNAAGPVKSYADPRIEIYAPTDTFPYYRVVGYDRRHRRVVNTSGGRTLISAKAKASRIAKNLRRSARASTLDPSRVLVHSEVERWLDPANHRSRRNRPWSQRHADNYEREWRLRIAPHIPKRATADELNDKHLWIRILNHAQGAGLSPASVQKTGAVCRNLISWLMDRELLDRNPMRGVTYSMTRTDNEGLDPKTVRPEQIPNLDMVYDLALAMSLQAWPHRPGRGGNRSPDAVGPAGRGLQPMLVAMTGLRNGELFALRPSRIDLAGLEIHITEQLVEEDSGARYFAPPKHGSIRTVTFAAFLQHDLKDLIDHRRAVSGEPDPILFCASRGGLEWRTNHTRRYRTAADRAGWPDHITWYGLRHLYAVTMLERLPLEIVSRLMGHHSPDFTARCYLSLRVGWLDQARAASRTFDPDDNAGAVDSTQS
jgi:integrase